MVSDASSKRRLPFTISGIILWRRKAAQNRVLGFSEKNQVIYLTWRKSSVTKDSLTVQSCSNRTVQFEFSHPNDR